MITGLKHIAIYTKDMELTKEFYINKLGFKNVWEGMVEVKSGTTHACTLQMGTCVLEIVLPPVLDSVHSAAGPVQHFALKVDHLEETILELKNKGINVKEDIEFITYEGGILHAFIYGPSNERIELVEEKRMVEEAKE